MYRLGIDIGSTTAKAVVRDNDEKTVFSKYVRHNADITACLDGILQECENVLGDCELEAVITGSAGLGVSERIGLPFVQEVIAVSNFVQSCDMNVNTLIDIGGEDAKIIFLTWHFLHNKEIAKIAIAQDKRAFDFLPRELREEINKENEDNK